MARGVTGVGTARFKGHDLAFTVRGRGNRSVILVHGLLCTQRMHSPLAHELAARGNRVITLDLLGHGASDRPMPTETYSVGSFAEQVVAVLDHLGVEEAIVGGTSLGANVALTIASRHPGRVRGLYVEMPVLDNALLACAMAFTPLAALLGTGAPVVRVLTAPTRLVRRGVLPWYADVILDILRQDPAAASRVLRGLLFGQTAPTRGARVRITAPALIVGHPRDPIHPLTDSGMLARELPNARLVRARSIAELRLWPRRLTDTIADFVDSCWRAEAGLQEIRRSA